MDQLIQMERTGIVPVIKIPAVEYAVPLAKTLYESGFRQIEVTLRNDCALACIAAIKEVFPDMLVAAGTVLSPDQACAAKDAGAEMIVTPGLNEKVIHTCRDLGLPVLPGCVTATEIEKGMELGIKVFKFFPAEPMGGLRTIRELARPYSQVRFVPTCGISMKNLEEYLAAPCVAAVGGSFMAPESKVLSGDWDGIRELCIQALTIARRIRGEKADFTEKKIASYKTAEAVGQETIHAPKVVGFGDFLVRLSAPGYLRLRQAHSFDINYTGAEANVLVSLSCMGVDTEFVTRLPKNAIAQSGLDELRRFGVGTSRVVWGGERMGLFYIEKGASQRPSRIVYDRKFSGIAMAEPDMFDWNMIFAGASHFHITGITPALGGFLPQISIQAVKEAKHRGLTVSCDLNYRNRMWTAEEARACMEAMLPYIDIVIANEEDADKVLGIRARDTDVNSGKLSREGYIDVASQICAKYGVKKVGITLRRSVSASDNDWGALLYQNGTPYFSMTYPIHIVDRVGGGDSFAAGLIYGEICGFEPQKQIEYAAAASCLKHSIEMDFNLSDVSEVELLMNGNGSGRVQR